MERFTKSELGAKNFKFVDRPEFGLVFAQLDVEASLIGKFHLNSPIVSDEMRQEEKSKMADGGHVFRQIDFALVLVQLDIEGNILTKI